jgi:hypothetical protein
MPLALATALALLAPTPSQQADVETLGGGSAGFASQPRLAIDGAPLVGKPFGLRITHAPANAIGVIAASATSAPVPLPEFGATAHPLPPYFAFAVVSTDASGTSPSILMLPSMPASFVGVEFHAQALVADPGALGQLAFTAARSIRVGDGDGEPDFLGPQIPVGGPATFVLAADVDANGTSDLVTSIAPAVFDDPDTIEVRLGDGAGGFGAPFVFTAASQVIDIRAVDFDRDGNLDIFLSYKNFFGSDADYSVHLGAGDGTFGASTGVVLGTWSTKRFDVVSLGGDNVPDLMALGSQGLQLLEGAGDGTFALWASPTFATVPADVCAGDLNGDRVLDLVVAVSAWPTGPRDVLVHLGDGTGGFAHVATYPPAPTSILGFELADVDGDQDLDLLECGVEGFGPTSQTTFDVRLGMGDGTFGPEIVQAADSFISIAGGSILDFDGDGNLDILHVLSFVQYTLGNGDGTFGAVQSYPNYYSSARGAALQFDGDGFTDVVLANSVSSNLSVLRGLAGALLDAPGYNLSTTAEDLTVGDFDRDGVDDLVVVTPSPEKSKVQIVLGNGAGGFGLSFEGTVGFDALAVEVADLDGDGRLDIVVANNESDSVSVFLGNGDGTAGAAIEHTVGDGPWRLAVGDVDGDGVVDVVTASRNSDDLSVSIGLGDGSFAPAGSIPAGDKPIGLGLCDLNGDGHTDLVHTNEAIDTLSVRLGTGGGAFGPPVTLPTGDSPHVLELIDIDQDGATDAVVANRYSDDLSVFLGNGDGTFAAPTVHPVGEWPFQISLVDADRDGILDLVVASAVGTSAIDSSLSLLRGTGAGGLAPFEEILAGRSRTTGLAALDADGDALPDLVVVYDSGSGPSFLGRGVVVLRNRLFE